MFLTEEEAKQRLEDARNLFSPSYVPSRYEGEVSPDNEDESHEEVEKDEIDHHTAPAPADIDRLLSGAADPYEIRHRRGQLRGQVDVQVAIGATASVIGDRKAGNLFGLSSDQADAYERGLSSQADVRTGLDRIPERGKRLASVKEQLAELASSRLSSALTSLTVEKIDGCKPSQVSTIAKDMAVVLDKVTKETSKPESIHFHIFRPEMKSVSEYTTVHVGSPLIIPDGGL